MEITPPEQRAFVECLQHDDVDILTYVKNKSDTTWPETAALQFCFGVSAFGCPSVPLAGLSPGEVCQVTLDLRNVTECCELIWCVVDGITGVVLDTEQLVSIVLRTLPRHGDDDVSSDEASSTCSSYLFPSSDDESFAWVEREEEPYVPEQYGLVECTPFQDVTTFAYVRNNSDECWPNGTVLKFCFGASCFGCDIVPVGPLSPGEVKEVVLELRGVSEEGRLVWCVVNGMTDAVLDTRQLVTLDVRIVSSGRGNEKEESASHPSSSSSFLAPDVIHHALGELGLLVDGLLTPEEFSGAVKVLEQLLR